MNKKAELPFQLIIVLIIISAVIIWYIFFSGQIGSQASRLIGDLFR